MLSKPSLSQPHRSIFMSRIAFRSRFTITPIEKIQVGDLGSTFMKRKISNFLLFSSKGKHQCIPPHLRFFILQLSLLPSCLCTYIAGVCWNPRMHYYPFLYHLDPIVVESPLVVLCLADRTTVEAEWQVPIVRFRTFYTLVHVGMLRTWIVDKMV
jgi:hypothetical protein